MNDFLKSQQITETDECKQFEMFTTYCVIAQQYSEQFDICDIITGAGGDCGIDGLAILVNGVLVSSVEEIDDLIEINKSLTDITFMFIQSKTSAKFSSSEIGTFRAGVLDFFSDSPKFVRSEIIKEKSAIVEHILNNATYMKAKPTCLMYYVTTGRWLDDANCIARIEMAKKDLCEQSIFSNIKFTPIDADLIQKLYRNTIDVIETEIDFSEKILLPDIQNVTQAYLGYVSVGEYLKLITDEKQEIRKSVFYDNVRDYQGNNAVNSEISETVKTDAEKFILFNNGITIICKKLTNLRNKFTLSDYQIVNGCQSSHVIYYCKDSVVGNLQIPIKIIETTDDDTVSKIIKATNRQTEVSDEQLVALNEFHRKLEAYFLTFSGQQKLYYERRSKQYCYAADIEKVRIVSISTQIRATASMFFDKPHLASRYYGRLLKSAEGIFNNQHKPLPYYTSAYLLYKIEFLFRNKMIPAEYRKYRFFMLMLVKYDLSPNGIPDLNSNKIEQLCQAILDCANETTKLIAEIEKVISVINKYVTDITNTEMTKSALLVEQCKQEYRRPDKEIL